MRHTLPKVAPETSLSGDEGGLDCRVASWL